MTSALQELKSKKNRDEIDEAVLKLWFSADPANLQQIDIAWNAAEKLAALRAENAMLKQNNTELRQALTAIIKRASQIDALLLQAKGYAPAEKLARLPAPAALWRLDNENHPQFIRSWLLGNYRPPITYRRMLSVRKVVQPYQSQPRTDCPLHYGK